MFLNFKSFKLYYKLITGVIINKKQIDEKIRKDLLIRNDIQPCPDEIKPQNIEHMHTQNLLDITESLIL